MIFDDVSGLIPLNKPRGITSRAVYREIVKILGKKIKVGHVGTLDPMAQGVLPVLIGKATRLSSYLLDFEKTYLCTLELGKLTDTLDNEGDVLKREDFSHVRGEALIAALRYFQGKITQTPPIYSAIKFNGQPLYAYARKGQEVDLSQFKREVDINYIKALSFDPPFFTFLVTCSSGTYIRSLVNDIAAMVSSIGTLVFLERTSASGLTLENSLTLSELSSAVEEFTKNKKPFWLPIDKIPLTLSPLILQDDDQLKKINLGQFVDLNKSQLQIDSRCNELSTSEDVLLFDKNKQIVGLGNLINHDADKIRIHMKRSLR